MHLWLAKKLKYSTDLEDMRKQMDSFQIKTSVFTESDLDDARLCNFVKIIGVELSDANATALSLHHGQRVVLDKVGGFADCIAVKEVGEETFCLCKELVDGIVVVSRDAVCAAIKDMFMERKRILEPAGALALVGDEAYCRFYKIKGENVVAITSGANMSFADLEW